MTSYQLTDAERARTERIDQAVVLGDVVELIDSLGDASWTVRRAAVAGLASLGDEAVGPLCVWLSDRRASEHAIAAAVDALVGAQSDRVLGEVGALVEHPRWEVAADAAAVLGRRRAPEAVAALCRAIDHPNDNVAIAAIEGLGMIGGTTGIDALAAATRTANFFRVFAAMQVLARIADPRAIDPLVALLAQPLYRDEAARALGRTGSSDAIAPLVALLDAADRETDLLVATALGDVLARSEWNGAAEHAEAVMRAHAGNLTTRFTSLLAHGEPIEGSRQIAEVVGWLGGLADLQQLMLGDGPKSDHVLGAVQRIARRHQDALPQVLVEADSRLRGVLLPIVTSRRSAVVVRELLADDDDEIRALACHALARIGDIAAIPLLFAALDNPRPRVGLAATFAIHSLGAADTETRTVRLLREGSPVARRHALRIVAYMGFVNAFDAVWDAILDRDHRIGELAIATLGALDDPRIDGALETLVQIDRPAAHRIAAMRAFSHRTGDRVLGILRHGVADQLPWVRYYACQGLGRHHAAAELVIERLRDDSPHVRLAAIEAHAQFDSPVTRQAVIDAASSEDSDELRAALLGIGLTPREESLPVLMKAAGSTDLATQLVALSGLARYRVPSALDRIVESAIDRRPELRDTAVSLLVERDDREAADALVDIVTRIDDELHPAHLALSRPSPARLRAIRQRFERADERAAITLAAALARMPESAGVATLFELLVSPNPVARRIAATVLIRIGQQRAAEVVLRMSREDPDPIVRSVCAAAAKAAGE